MTSRSVAVVLLSCAWGAQGAAAQAPQYALTEVGPRPLLFWAAYDLGPQGQVVGRSWNLNTTPPQSRAWLWHNGTMTTLDGPAGETVTEARCIDDHGVVYGGYADRRFDLIFLKMNPVRWVNGAPIPYPNNDSVNSSTIFAAAPTSGAAVGWAKPFTPGAPGWQGQYGYPSELPFAEGDPVRAFVWTPAGGAVLARGMGAHDDRAADINDAGQAAVVMGSHEHGGPARYDPRCGLARLPDLGGQWNWTQVFAINAPGQIVGYSQNPAGVERPVRWDGAVLTDLGLLPGFAEGQALDINDAGVIVGGLAAQAGPFGVRPTAGFVHINGAMHNLNALIPPGSGFVVQQAHAINNAGQILVSMDAIPISSNTRYAVLTPVR